MRKVRISSLLLIMLLAFTVSTVVVSAANIKEIIEFRGLASGPCSVAYGLGTRGTDPIPDQEIWYLGDGIGTTKIGGEAQKLKLVEFTEPLWGEGYESTEIKALGYVSASWTNTVEEVEEENWLLAVIFSSASTYGFFKPNEVFSMPIPGVTPTPKFKENLLFKGIHVIDSEINIIEGFALCVTTPLTSVGLPAPGYLYGVGLVIPLEGDDQVMYQLMWSDGGIGGIPLADAIEWNVEEG